MIDFFSQKNKNCLTIKENVILKVLQSNFQHKFVFVCVCSSTVSSMLSGLEARSLDLTH